jgi:FixJ family two-component response regulator
VIETLSSEELQVLELICLGRTSGRIAKDLGISFQAAVWHRMCIVQKMEAVRRAMTGKKSTSATPKQV